MVIADGMEAAVTSAAMDRWEFIAADDDERGTLEPPKLLLLAPPLFQVIASGDCTDSPMSMPASGCCSVSEVHRRPIDGMEGNV